jgi:predicted Rossmann fold flavoprotein
MGKRDCVVIVGGGAAGMMAALSARRHNPDHKVILVEHEESLGRKLLVCGAGRCNVTNVNVVPERFSGAPAAFVASVLEEFDHEDVQDFFEDLGVPLYEEKKSAKGKLFPVTNQAQTVLAMLIDELERAGVEIRTGVHVDSAIKDGEGFKIKTEKGPMWSTQLLLSTGGKTYPKLGGDGSGYALAKGFGHSIVDPVPTALPLVARNPVSKRVHGVRAELEIAAIVGGKEICRDSDQMMFTKYGFTGPAVLNVSRPIALRLHREKKNDCELEINFLPRRSRADAERELESRWKKRPGRRLSLSLAGLMQNKLPPAILAHLEMPDSPARDLTAGNRKRLLDFLTGWRVPVQETRGWDEGEFTAGGVDCAEVEPGTLASKRTPGLFFAGEVLDVDGEVGGFNLTWAWSSGFAAGKLGACG